MKETHTALPIPPTYKYPARHREPGGRGMGQIGIGTGESFSASRLQPSAVRIFTSSLFGYLLFGLLGYFHINTTAKEIAGAQTGVVFTAVSCL